MCPPITLCDVIELQQVSGDRIYVETAYEKLYPSASFFVSSAHVEKDSSVFQGKSSKQCFPDWARKVVDILVSCWNIHIL